jgi:hypothetical protein
VQIVVGKSWSVKTLSGNETLEISFYMERWMKEKKGSGTGDDNPTA